MVDMRTVLLSSKNEMSIHVVTIFGESRSCRIHDDNAVFEFSLSLSATSRLIVSSIQ
jgi:hypothetical protein